MAVKDVPDIAVINAYKDSGFYRDNGETVVLWPEELLVLRTGQCRKVCIRAMERAERRGLIECGTSLRSGWITDKGFELLTKGVSDADTRPESQPIDSDRAGHQSDADRHGLCAE